MKQDMQSDNFNILHLIHIQETNGVSIQAMIMLIALWIHLKTSHIRCALLSLDTSCFILLVAGCAWPLSALCVGILTVEYNQHRDVKKKDRLEYHIREDLNKIASRTMVVLNPLKVVITNMEAGTTMDLDAKKWPDAQNDDVPFSNVVYIEQSDFRLKDSKDYYGLAPGKSVLLRYAFPIKCTDVILGDDKETVVEIRAEYDPSKKTKPKGVLHWVAEPSPWVEPLKVEVRLFDKLFLSENPAELDDWLSDLNPHSKVVVAGAYAVPALKSAAVGDRFQFERLGYFVVDKDSTLEKLVFNRTITLQDSY
ncbi:Glutamyl/glutaminyl-tRNA synthetase, class Ib, anti-codon binding domain, partial [Dillenia turbinata]